MHDASRRKAMIDAATPLGERLLRAPLYPLRGAALATLVTLSFAHLVVGFLPGFTSLLAGGVVWVSLFIYALECLHHTGDGYTDPAEVSLEISQGSGIALLVVQVLAVIATVLAQLIPMLWPLVLLLMLLLPAMTISLAFGDHLGAAIDPVRLGASLRAFGPAYLLPVVIGGIQQLVYWNALTTPGHLATAAWMTVTFYLVLVNFHVMGLLVHRYHAEIGHTPESALSDSQEEDDDERLLSETRQQTTDGDIDGAIKRLAERIRNARAPDAIHQAYRNLLHRQGRKQELIEHAHAYITSLLGTGQARRALGVVQACIDHDPKFVPSEPDQCAELAQAAARHGMPRLALILGRAYPNKWPRGADAARCGLLAARTLADHFERPEHAIKLAGKLLQAYPQAPEREQIKALLQRLQTQGDAVP